MSKRSEKEARNNDDLVSQFFPVLAVTALLSYFQYRKLKKQYLANPQAKRIDDLMAHTPILVVATFGIMLVLGGVYSLAMWTFKGHAGYAPVIALAAYAGWLAINAMWSLDCWMPWRLPRRFRRGRPFRRVSARCCNAWLRAKATGGLPAPCWPFSAQKIFLRRDSP